MHYTMLLPEAPFSDVHPLGFLRSGLGDILTAMKMVEREVSALVKDEVSRKTDGTN